VLIQTKFRQYLAKTRVGVMRDQKQAATTIQAVYRGFKARQHVRRMRYARRLITAAAATLSALVVVVVVVVVIVVA